MTEGVRVGDVRVGHVRLGHPAAPDEAPSERVPWRSVVVFVLIAYALMWLGTVPFWLSPLGLAMPGAQLILVAVMFAPALASLVAVRLVERRHWLRAVGLRSAGPIRRIVGYAGLAVVVIAVSLLVVLAVSAAVGLQRLDLTGLSGVRLAEPAQLSRLSPALYLAVLGINAIIAILTVNAVSALGEEIGWRGFLLGRLLPLGRGPAVLLSGSVWGLWHLPLILLGYEYPGAPRGWAVMAFLGFTVAIGSLLAWLRLRSGSVIPGAFAHGTLNALAPSTFLLLVGGRPGPVLLGAPMGLVAIIILAALGIGLFVALPAGRAAGRIRWRSGQAPAPDAPEPGRRR